ncbi:MAG TPA: dihydrolipoyllysine-residue succinyltransferase [Bacteroidales bacterium]|nr:MAG: 2-oxoglutarate dehydrogenase [Bacteroidetes bacterium GWF2_33_38]OFY68285.1 MAG: 2-oxoglutarate dehydrogenase [Bacteroidetes bacterium RIFOXYA12_FULL_33_9]OFY88321.1 MAG: 2-oxoglutarate dehydrogenase [Bacteroidetes bacterium RIFOXYA2_FULL_33_7]HBF89191.1 dihydrolipoyllysine-residue succinyltransferase [Bacteroidales bacterium]
MIEIKIPSPGESITEVEIASWLVKDGDFVEKDQEIAEIESDKATLSLVAEASGKINILAKAGIPVPVNSIACTIEPNTTNISDNAPQNIFEKETIIQHSTIEKIKITPLAKKIIQDNHLSINNDFKGYKKIQKADVLRKISSAKIGEIIPEHRQFTRTKMSMLRRKISQRLVAVKNETAMLTTFNEIDMSNIINLRATYKDAFQQKHGVKMGYMSIFTKAVSDSLKEFPNVNAIIDGEDIINFNYSDIGIAVQTDKGLMVPILRNTEQMSIAEIELNIAELAEKGRTGKISLEELTGGTFTISNGGVFGSLLSTPILNPPQSAILGMHNIVKRPIVVDDKIEIRQMMYVALSYDHRIIDGRDSVGFLIAIKKRIENPITEMFGDDIQNALSL